MGEVEGGGDMGENIMVVLEIIGEEEEDGREVVEVARLYPPPPPPPLLLPPSSPPPPPSACLGDPLVTSDVRVVPCFMSGLDLCASH